MRPPCSNEWRSIMKRIVSVCLLIACLFLISALTVSSPASAASRITDLSQLDDNTFYTKEDMLAAYELGYNKGLQDAGGVDTPNDNITSCDYVLNTNTRKFHYPDCSSVQDIAPYNAEYFSGSRDEAIARGYKPCGRCKP